MRKATLLIVLAFCFFGLVGLSGAATYTYEFAFDGIYEGMPPIKYIKSAAGSNMFVGDNVEVTFSAVGTGYWSADANTKISEPIAIYDDGTRIGDLYWTFFLDGVVVDSGYALDKTGYYTQLPIYATTSKAINFDKLYWIYTLDSSTANSNILDVLVNEWTTLLDFSDYHASANVPEPTTMLLLGLGLIGLAGVKRKIKR